MIIRNKEESLYYLEKLGLNYFTEKVFDPTDNMLLSKVEEFLDENNQNIEQLARNICKLKGIDFDNEFSSFMSNFKRG